MTFKEKAIALMEEQGMFKQDAEEVFEAIKVAPENEPMQQRWNEGIGGYPPAMLGVLWLTVKRHALEWIDANCPKAWYREMFDEEQRHG